MTIEIHTCSYRSTRGYAIPLCALDEVAFWPNTDDAAEPDVEVLRALAAATAQFPNRLLLIASSPYAKRGVLFENYKNHFGKGGDPILVWQAPTRSMNPSIDQAVTDTEMERDPVAASSEYLALWRQNLESFIDRAVIENATDYGVAERAYRGLRHVAFTDPSGGSQDSWTMAVCSRDADIIYVDALRDIRPPFSPEAVVAEFAGLLKSYHITKVFGDRYGGEFPKELFRRHHIHYQTADQSKSDLYVEFLALINSGRVHLVDHVRLRTQLIGLERRTARSGRESIDHAPGQHDDICNAVAGACVSLQVAAKRRIRCFAVSNGYPTGPGYQGREFDPQTGETIEPERFSALDGARATLGRAGVSTLSRGSTPSPQISTPSTTFGDQGIERRAAKSIH